MSKLLLRIIFSICLIISEVRLIKFDLEVRSISMQCLGEYLADKTLCKIILYLGIFKLSANSKDIRVRLFDPNGHAVFNRVR